MGKNNQTLSRITISSACGTIHWDDLDVIFMGPTESQHHLNLLLAKQEKRNQSERVKAATGRTTYQGLCSSACLPAFLLFACLQTAWAAVSVQAGSVPFSSSQMCWKLSAQWKVL